MMRPDAGAAGRQIEFPTTVEADLYVRCLMVNTRLSAGAAAEDELKNPSGFINPARDARNFHWRPATLAESVRWPEPGQSRNPQLRNKC